MAAEYRKAIRRVAVIGCGVIGASWAAEFLARGLDVIATDPAEDAELRLRQAVARAWPVLERVGLSPGADQARLAFLSETEEAAAAADFIQENGPERLELKRELYRRLDGAAASDVVIASSSSGLKPSQIQDGCVGASRILVGHPFNPPHLIPLVEVVGGTRTDEGAIEAAMGFYAGLGKRPIRIRQELIGHVANRLQAALWREAYHLVDIGAVSVAGVDAAISHGPGLRWALMGPVLLSHLSGGAGGLRHLLEHLGPLSEAMWADLGSPALTGGLKRKLIEGVEAEIGATDLDAAVAERDHLLTALVADKAAARHLP